jgi:hypothetical protein
MPYKDKEKRRAYDRERKRRIRAMHPSQRIVGFPPNPLTAEEWRALQRYVGRINGWAWNTLNKLAAVWDVPPFR